MNVQALSAFGRMEPFTGTNLTSRPRSVSSETLPRSTSLARSVTVSRMDFRESATESRRTEQGLEPHRTNPARPSPSGTPTSRADEYSNSRETNSTIRSIGSTSVEAYIEMIRMLAPDKQQASAALNRIEDYAAGGSAESESTSIQIDSRIAYSESFTLEVGTVPAGGSASSKEAVRVDVEGEVSDPLVIDLDGDGIELTSLAEGIRFDLNADGRNEKTAFVRGGDAFLALDRNKNGIIDNGSELFGDQNGAVDGFAELQKFDSNADFVIDAKDSIFEQLILFRGTQPGDTGLVNALQSLSDAGIESISLNATESNERQQGNLITATSVYRSANGSSSTIANVLLQTTA